MISVLSPGCRSENCRSCAKRQTGQSAEECTGGHTANLFFCGFVQKQISAQVFCHHNRTVDDGSARRFERLERVRAGQSAHLGVNDGLIKTARRPQPRNSGVTADGLKEFKTLQSAP